MSFTSRQQPLFVVAIVACIAVVAIQGWTLAVAPAQFDEIAATAAMFLVALFAWCLSRTSTETAHG